MGFWFFMYIMGLMIPAFMIVFGWYFQKYGVKTINHFVGYRTTWSRKNQDTWQFAQKLYGRYAKIAGWITLIFSLIVPVFYLHSTEEKIGMYGGILCGIQIISIIIPVFMVEKALRMNFDENGDHK